MMPALPPLPAVNSLPFRLALPLLAWAILPGCYAKFKEAAPTLGAVQTEVYTVGAPFVSLGYSSDEGVVGAVINVVQTVRSVSQTDRIAGAVDVEAVNAEFERSLAAALGDGPPFGWTDDKNAPLLQLEVTAWGLDVPYLGAPGYFSYSMNVKIYRPNGERVYSSYITCDVNAGNPDLTAEVLGVVNNVKQLNDMTDGQINDAFLTVARWCGQDLVLQMRRHAG